MNRQFVLFALSSSIVTCLFCSAVAFAEQTATTINAGKAETKLEEVVVTATKIAERTGDIPASVQVITSEDIKTSTARDAGDLIAEAGLGHVHKYPGALTSRIELRGLATDLFTETKSRVLLLINGNRTGTVNLAKIPVEDIERIEIVKGPASVLYGSSAMGGVINIITKQGKDGFHGSVGAEGGSWDYWKTMSELSGTKGAFDYYLMGSISSSGDYEAKHYGTIQNSGSEDESVSTRIGYRLFDKHRVSLGLQHWKGWDIGSPGARYKPDPDNYSNKARDSFDVGYTSDTLSAKYYLTYNKDDSFGGMTSGPGNSDHFTSITRSQGASIQNVFPIGEHRVILGGQWDRIGVDSSRNSGAPYYPNSLYDNFGLYTEGRISLFDKKLLVNAGLRYDTFSNSILATPGITGLNPQTKDFDHLTARGGLVYKPFEGLSLKGSVGTAFRAPAPGELASDYVSFGARTVGNPNLNPEKSTTYDTGFEYARALFKGGFTFFHTEFSDKIVSFYDSANSVQTYKNVGGATLQGVEVNASYDAGLAAGLDLSIEPFANVTYKTRYDSDDPAEVKKTGATLLYIPEWTGAFGVRAGQEKWDARLSVDYTGDELVQDWAPPSNGKNVVNKGGFTVVNLKGSYKPVKNLELSASIGNLFDREYAYARGYPMPGRTFIGGVKWLF
jgi:vitamin B12 transporter